MIGSYGIAILTGSLLGALAIVCTWAGSYAAHCLLVVVEQTAAGSDDVVWPDEPFLDWLWKIVYLVWLAAVWLVPLGLLHRLVLTPALGNPPPFTVLAVVWLWLMAPLSLLSSLSATSWFVVMRWPVLGQLVRRPRSLMHFFVATLLLAVGGSTLVFFALIGWEPMYEEAVKSGPTWLPDVIQYWAWLFVLPLTAVLMAAALLWYARLLGRLAWIMNGARKIRPRTVDRQLPVSQPLERPGLPAVVAVEPHASDAVTMDETYKLRDDDPPAADEKKPAAVYALDLQQSPRQPYQHLEKEEDEEEETVAPGSVSLTSRVLGFPWYRGSLRAFGWLTFDGLCVLVIVRALLMWWST